VTATRPTAAALDLVVERDSGRCAWCGAEVSGERGRDWSLHHRRPAGMGGDRRPETHLPGNLVLLCGSGTTRCHGEVESRRGEAMHRGFLVSRHAVQSPAHHAIEHAVHGWTCLLDDGSVSTDPPVS
jgi:hypothetical protein